MEPFDFFLNTHPKSLLYLIFDFKEMFCDSNLSEGMVCFGFNAMDQVHQID
jgi:hypothetical protein